MKIRIHYTKLAPLSFISHLDVQKTFHRAFRRSKIALIYSAGFNPHPKVSFAPPLPVFSSSLDEVMDVQIKDELQTEEIIKRLNAALPEKIQVTKAQEVAEEALPLSKALESAEYKFTILSPELSEKQKKEITEYFTASKKIEIDKKSKSKVTRIDLKEFILSFKSGEEGGKMVIYATLPLSHERITSPSLIVQAIKEKFKDIEDLSIDIQKTKTNLKK